MSFQENLLFIFSSKNNTSIEIPNLNSNSNLIENEKQESIFSSDCFIIEPSNNSSKILHYISWISSSTQITLTETLSINFKQRKIARTQFSFNSLINFRTISFSINEEKNQLSIFLSTFDQIIYRILLTRTFPLEKEDTRDDLFLFANEFQTQSQIFNDSILDLKAINVDEIILSTKKGKISKIQYQIQTESNESTISLFQDLKSPVSNLECDGNHLFIFLLDGTLKIYDLFTKSQIHSINIPKNLLKKKKRQIIEDYQSAMTKNFNEKNQSFFIVHTNFGEGFCFYIFHYDEKDKLNNLDLVQIISSPQTKENQLINFHVIEGLANGKKEFVLMCLFNDLSPQELTTQIVIKTHIINLSHNSNSISNFWNENLLAESNIPQIPSFDEISSFESHILARLFIDILFENENLIQILQKSLLIFLEKYQIFSTEILDGQLSKEELKLEGIKYFTSIIDSIDSNQDFYQKKRYDICTELIEIYLECLQENNLSITVIHNKQTGITFLHKESSLSILISNSNLEIFLKLMENPRFEQNLFNQDQINLSKLLFEIPMIFEENIEEIMNQDLFNFQDPLIKCMNQIQGFIYGSNTTSITHEMREKFKYKFMKILNGIQNPIQVIQDLYNNFTIFPTKTSIETKKEFNSQEKTSALVKFILQRQLENQCWSGIKLLCYLIYFLTFLPNFVEFPKQTQTTKIIQDCFLKPIPELISRLQNKFLQILIEYFWIFQSNQEKFNEKNEGKSILHRWIVFWCDTYNQNSNFLDEAQFNELWTQTLNNLTQIHKENTFGNFLFQNDYPKLSKIIHFIHKYEDESEENSQLSTDLLFLDANFYLKNQKYEQAFSLFMQISEEMKQNEPISNIEKFYHSIIQQFQKENQPLFVEKIAKIAIIESQNPKFQEVFNSIIFTSLMGKKKYEEALVNIFEENNTKILEDKMILITKQLLKDQNFDLLFHFLKTDLFSIFLKALKINNSVIFANQDLENLVEDNFTFKAIMFLYYCQFYMKNFEKAVQILLNFSCRLEKMIEEQFSLNEKINEKQKLLFKYLEDFYVLILSTIDLMKNREGILFKTKDISIFSEIPFEDLNEKNENLIENLNENENLIENENEDLKEFLLKIQNEFVFENQNQNQNQNLRLQILTDSDIKKKWFFFKYLNKIIENERNFNLRNLINPKEILNILFQEFNYNDAFTFSFQFKHLKRIFLKKFFEICKKIEMKIEKEKEKEEENNFQEIFEEYQLFKIDYFDGLEIERFSHLNCLRFFGQRFKLTRNKI
ncbi:hypothetical protein M0811_04570 [Anaeramoeba ignava]|uniref:Uncharacterized protein n=1 Tax=Anaeramoeba ignava TaxID=1746090 RepID=A0A9Q0LTV8_ANAIG|nr:hypothetical protein M0811_04570 [Anaeramoeba ignava]